MQEGFVKATEKVRENIMTKKDPWGVKILKHEKAFMDKFDKYAVEPW